jgi:phosphatidylinositol-bisphosphatase
MSLLLASAGAQGASSRGKVKVLVATLDGCMVAVYKGGRVDKYTELGRLVWSLDAHTELLCAIPVGR